VDGTATAVLARQQGRTLASWRKFMENGRFSVSPVWQYDQGRAEAGLNELAAELAAPAVEAQLVWQNGRFDALPGQPGQEMDVAASLVALAGQTSGVVANGRFEPVMRFVSPTLIDLSEVAAQANTLLAGSLTIQAYDPVADETFSRTVLPEMWGSWLIISKGVGPVDWELNEAALAEYGQTWAAEWGKGRFVDEVEMKTAVTNAVTSHNPSAAVRVYHPSRSHVVQSGETLSSIGRNYGIPYPWIQQANPGLETLSIGQTIVIPSPDEMIPLPVAANKRIVVNMAQQRAWVYENGALKWEWPVSTGINSSPTAPGVFQIQSHEPNAYAGIWDLWMPSFMGIYRPVPTSDFMNGFHGFPTRGGSNLLWTGDLGHPVTYGCILLSSENAQLLYDWAEVGVVVEIQS
jgi:lipoprotein-anchoring transpeptidase ErfK/SrfK